MQKSEFDDAGVVWFSESKRRQIDSRRLQAGMFMDRPDLWRRPRRGKAPSKPPEQQELFEGEEL